MLRKASTKAPTKSSTSGAASMQCQCPTSASISIRLSPASTPQLRIFQKMGPKKSYPKEARACTYLSRMSWEPVSGAVLSCEPAMISNGHLMSSYRGRFAFAIVRQSDLYPSAVWANKRARIKAFCVAVALGPVAANGTTFATPSIPSAGNINIRKACGERNRRLVLSSYHSRQA